MDASSEGITIVARPTLPAAHIRLLSFYMMITREQDGQVEEYGEDKAKWCLLLLQDICREYSQAYASEGPTCCDRSIRSSMSDDELKEEANWVDSLGRLTRVDTGFVDALIEVRNLMQPKYSD